jgi:hypothetical protein
MSIRTPEVWRLLVFAIAAVVLWQLSPPATLVIGTIVWGIYFARRLRARRS